MTYLKSSIISSSLLVFSGACLTSSLRFFTLRCLCHRVSNDWLFETLKNKLFLEQSLKLSLASVMPSLFVLISFATFVFGRLLTVFSLSLKYEASQLRNRFFFFNFVSACFASQLPQPDLVAFLLFPSWLLNLFFKLSNCCLALLRLREKMCALLLWYTMYSEFSFISQDTCFLILWVLINVVLDRYNNFKTDDCHI